MIDNFQGNYMFLSNFYMHDIEYEGITYPSSEHAYQAAKTTNVDVRRTIAGLATAGMAKKHGRKVNLRPDWDSVKDGVMEDILKIKFSNPILRQKLLDTGDEELIEGNWWGDRYWGMVKPTPQSQWEGKNMLGKTLMKIRDSLK
jgi:ribA/ribD-fused uncharacterized protein